MAYTALLLLSGCISTTVAAAPADAADASLLANEWLPLPLLPPLLKLTDGGGGGADAVEVRGCKKRGGVKIRSTFVVEMFDSLLLVRLPEPLT